MSIFCDQLNREIYLPSKPERIISVVPSQTELLFYLGLDQEIIGITKFCIHPTDKFKMTPKVGGTKQLDVGLIKSLKPDLIIANKEENDRSQVEELTNICPVWISDINNLAGAIEMIEGVGAVVRLEDKAKALVDDIQHRFDKFHINELNLRVAYFIWRKPYMVAGKGTFIDHMLQKCGLTNAFNLQRYPEVTREMLVKANPDVVFLSSEPYPFKEKHIDEFSELLPHAKVKVVDGELFSWYGSRLLRSPQYFEKLMKELELTQSLN